MFLGVEYQIMYDSLTVSVIMRVNKLSLSEMHGLSQQCFTRP